MNYYNEWDKHTAQWLRELIKMKLIPDGYVDERSIADVTASDLEGFTQCHFFAGIGGWSQALKLAGVAPTTRLWTGSPPCQPFSVAGKQLGQEDDRHLAPVFLHLVSKCKPPVLFGEQVAPAIAKSWMCDLQTHLEREDYAVGFAVLPACSVGAPHKRDRLFFGARQLANAAVHGHVDTPRPPHIRRVEQQQGRAYREEERQQPSSECCTEPRVMVRAHPGAHNSFWSDADWLGCRDGKFRPVEPGTFPLADGIPARVGRLRGYGNAIVPQIAAEFIQAFMD